jgi:hypothetical protein
LTALSQYARLECPGVWRAEPEAQRQEVVVAFGDASLVICDRAGRALSHWSLAAVARINPGGAPALYTPSAEATEVLEVADDTMVAAIETVRRAVARARPRGGRLRGAIFAALLAGLAALGVYWLPGALVRHTVSVLPEPTRAEIGAGLRQAIGRVSAPPCSRPRAERALDRLRARLAPDGPGSAGLVVLPDAVTGALALPGGELLVGRALVEDHETPEVLAGHVLAARVRAAAEPPLAPLLRHAGPVATLRLLTTGHLPAEVLPAYAETLLVERPAEPAAEPLLAAFAAAEVSSQPYAYARDVTGETMLPLIEADPMRGRQPEPLLPDGDWVALQGICGP